MDEEMIKGLMKEAFTLRKNLGREIVPEDMDTSKAELLTQGMKMMGRKKWTAMADQVCKEMLNPRR